MAEVLYLRQVHRCLLYTSYFYQDMSKDDDVPKKLQNDFLHQMYEDFGTIEEDCFYDRLEDGKYDEGFKERQVKDVYKRQIHMYLTVRSGTSPLGDVPGGLSQIRKRG